MQAAAQATYSLAAGCTSRTSITSVFEMFLSGARPRWMEQLRRHPRADRGKRVRRWHRPNKDRANRGALITVSKLHGRIERSEQAAFVVALTELLGNFRFYPGGTPPLNQAAVRDAEDVNAGRCHPPPGRRPFHETAGVGARRGPPEHDLVVGAEQVVYVEPQVIKEHGAPERDGVFPLLAAGGGVVRLFCFRTSRTGVSRHRGHADGR
jgi:hypothetical protein